MKMANKYKGTDKDIHIRINRFVVNCFRDVVQQIHKNTENNVIISQLASSLTSMGANDREADAAGSQKDFVARYTIVRKETNETIYWLTLVYELKLLKFPVLNSYLVEAKEIFKIVSTIIIHAKRG